MFRIPKNHWQPLQWPLWPCWSSYMPEMRDQKDKLSKIIQESTRPKLMQWCSLVWHPSNTFWSIYVYLGFKYNLALHHITPCSMLSAPPSQPNVVLPQVERVLRNVAQPSKSLSIHRVVDMDIVDRAQSASVFQRIITFNVRWFYKSIVLAAWMPLCKLGRAASSLKCLSALKTLEKNVEVKWSEMVRESVYSSDFFCVRIVRPSWDCQKKPLPSSSNNCNTRCAISTPSAGSAAGKFSCSLATSTRRASLVETTSFSTLHAGQLQRKPYLKIRSKSGKTWGKTTVPYDNNWAKSWWKWQKP